MAEFEFIEWLKSEVSPGKDVMLGIGDDCCALRSSARKDLLVTVDTMVEGAHFMSDTAPGAVGYKSLAVSLSDISAMGAVPRWAMVALTMPTEDEAWFRGFAKCFLELAKEYQVDLIGGNITQGPLSVTTVVHGQVVKNGSITRAGARPGDSVFVSGYLGGAAAGLRVRQGLLKIDKPESLIEALEYPAINVALGQSLRGIASAMIDISDGFIADLGHISSQSGVGADIQLPLIPCHPDIPDAIKYECACHGGDDYSLCFTVPQAKSAQIEALMAGSGVGIHRVGEITHGNNVRILDDSGAVVAVDGSGWQHFFSK